MDRPTSGSKEVGCRDKRASSRSFVSWCRPRSGARWLVSSGASRRRSLRRTGAVVDVAGEGLVGLQVPRKSDVRSRSTPRSDHKRVPRGARTACADVALGSVTQDFVGRCAASGAPPGAVEPRQIEVYDSVDGALRSAPLRAIRRPTSVEVLPSRFPMEALRICVCTRLHQLVIDELKSLRTHRKFAPERMIHCRQEENHHPEEG